MLKKSLFSPARPVAPRRAFSHAAFSPRSEFPPAFYSNGGDEGEVCNGYAISRKEAASDAWAETQHLAYE